MQYYNFINYIHIVDLSLLNFIDYSEVIQGSYQLVNDKFVINLNAKTKKILIAFILNNINDAIQYGYKNVIINTCKPMMNWRREIRNRAIRSYKYLIQDESVQLDLIKLNQFLEKTFERLPHYNINSLKKECNINNDIVNLSNLESVFGNVNFIELEDVDIYDAYPIIKNMFSSIGSVTFDTLRYNIINDGNCVYEHNLNFPDEILKNCHLQFLQKGLI